MIYITIIVTAIIVSAATAGLSYWVIMKKIKPRIEEDLDFIIQRRMEELTNEIKVGVSQGIVDGVSKIPSLEVLEGTTRSIAKAGAGLVEGGLTTLFGNRRNRREDKKDS